MPARINWDESEVMRRVEVLASGCWEWQGPLGIKGYARVSRRHGSGTGEGHRMVYELLVGPIPDGLALDHVCHNADSTCPGGDVCRHRRCVNPAHLEPVSSGLNTYRGAVRRTHCRNGHPYEGRNVIRIGATQRRCRQCRVEKQQRYRSRLRGETA